MKSISEKEKKLLETLDKLKNLENIKPDKILELENLANQKNQLEIEKKEIEQKTLVTRRKAKTGESPSTKSEPKKVVQIEKRTLKPTRAELSKKEQRELEGENFLSNVEKQEFEKPADLVSKNIQIQENHCRKRLQLNAMK